MISKIADTLYANYMRERSGSRILENEKGFVVYKISGSECFIQEMFIAEQFRAKGYGRELLQALTELALFEDCEALSATVYAIDKNATATLTSAFLCGFELVRAENGIVLIGKRIGGK